MSPGKMVIMMRMLRMLKDNCEVTDIFMMRMSTMRMMRKGVKLARF